MTFSPIPSTVLISIWNLWAWPLLSTFLSAVWSSEHSPELPVKLSLQHFRLSPSCFSKLFQTPPANQFQRLLNHMIRYSYTNDPTSQYQFSVLASHNCDRNTWKKSIYEDERFIVAHSFRVFSPWLLGPVAFGPVARQYTMAKSAWQRNLLTSWWSGSKERERNGLWFQYLLQGHAPTDLASFHLLKVLLPPNSMIGWQPSL